MTASPPRDPGPLQPADAAGKAGSDDREIQLLEYWRILVQRRGIVLTCLLVTVLATAIFTFLATPQYQATTTLEIKRQAPEILEFTDVVSVDPSGYSYRDFYRTQYRILQSDSVATLAAERLDLVHRPEFAGRRGSPLRRGIDWLRERLGSAPPEDDPLARAVEMIQDGLEIAPIRDSHLVRVSFTDRDPGLAAEIANAVAAAYQGFEHEAVYSTTGQAKEFLAKDVARYRAEIDELQRQLQAYGVDHEILGLSDQREDISEQALASVNLRLTESRSRLAEAEARQQSLVTAPPDALPQVAGSPVIAHLRQERASLERKQTQMSQRFAADWPPLRELERELATADEQLGAETDKIAAQVRAAAAADVARARSEVAALTAERDLQKREVQRVNLAAIEYAGLRKQIETKQRVMSDLVERQSETETSHRLGETSSSNIRVVDRARTPDRPASPKKALNLILSVVLGGSLGALLAFVFHHLDNTVKNEQEVAAIGGLTVLGHVPMTRALRVVPAGERTGDGDLTHQLDVASHIDPRCAFAETFRNLRTSLLLASPDHPPRQIVVTSCGPGDGKSTIALNLAIVLTQLGRRVLLLDADLRRPRVHKALSLPNDHGLSSYLSGNAELDDVMCDTELPNLRVVPSGPVPPNPSELLGSPRMQDLLDRAASEGGFDHVIFDSPPVLSVTDSIVLSTRMDATILVVRAGETTREALAQCAGRLRQTRARAVGAVLNAVSEDGGYYYYGRYGRKYQYDQREDPGVPESRWLRRRPGRGAKRAG